MQRTLSTNQLTSHFQLSNSISKKDLSSPFFYLLIVNSESSKNKLILAGNVNRRSSLSCLQHLTSSSSPLLLPDLFFGSTLLHFNVLEIPLSCKMRVLILLKKVIVIGVTHRHSQFFEEYKPDQFFVIFVNLHRAVEIRNLEN